VKVFVGGFDLGYKNKLAFVIPTYNRPDDLHRMLKSLSGQSVQCDQCIIVDASEEPVDYVLKEFPELNWDYAHVSPPSLSEQRNVGMSRLQPDITLAGYLDDDIVLLDGALEAMLTYWEKASDEIGGGRFNIEGDPMPSSMWLKALFLEDGMEMGVLLKSGHNTHMRTVSQDKYTQWLSGGATIWRREVISEFEYDEWYLGHGYLEDVDYSYRVGKKYKLVVLADARVLHLSPPLRKDKSFLFGQWQVSNRIYFVKKHPEFSVILCYWALLGYFLQNLFLGIIRPGQGHLMRAWGNCVGFINVLGGRIESVGGLFK